MIRSARRKNAGAVSARPVSPRSVDCSSTRLYVRAAATARRNQIVFQLLRLRQNLAGSGASISRHVTPPIPALTASALPLFPLREASCARRVAPILQHFVRGPFRNL